MTFALIRRLDEHARLRPDALALREVAESGAERTLSWRQLRDAAFRLAARLRRAPTGVVMICSPNRAEFVAALLGGLAADAPVLPVSPAAPAAELVDLSRRLSVSTLIGSGAALDALSECVAHRIPLDSIELDGRAPPAAPPEGSGSILLQSSGTTGLPKIVRRGAAALDAVGDACRAAP